MGKDAIVIKSVIRICDVNLHVILNDAGTAAYAKDSSNAAAKSEAEGENKSAEDDDKGGKVTWHKNIYSLVNVVHLLGCLLCI